MTEYETEMDKLADLVADAYLAAIRAGRAADNEDGAPVEAVRNIRNQLRAIEGDVESLINTRMTVKEYRDAERLYQGANLAGWTR